MTERIWIDAREVVEFHSRLLLIDGGGASLRDSGLLESAPARPRQRAACDRTADSCELAASYTAGIIRNHPFVDGNKRTGFLVGVLFLELNGHHFTAAEEEAARAVIDLAAGTLSESDYAAFLRANTVSGP